MQRLKLGAQLDDFREVDLEKDISLEAKFDWRKLVRSPLIPELDKFLTYKSKGKSKDKSLLINPFE